MTSSGGLRNVAVSESRISSIDGERGILAYRGIDIHPLAEHSGFEETAYLLHEGRLPTRAELAAYRADLARERGVPEPVFGALRALPRDAHPMTLLRTAVSALGAMDPDAGDDSDAARRRQCRRLIAQTATLVAAIERLRRGQPVLIPEAELSHAANLLYMMTGTRPASSAERAMDVALVLHADHE